MNEATQESNNPVKEYMISTSPKVEQLPRKLYHASSIDNYESIMKKGIKANPIFGQTYFCETKKQCLMFTGKDVNIYEVDSSELDSERFRISLDHNKSVFPFECYAYYEDIPVSAIKKVHKKNMMW
jgi:hypothetical protein